MEKKILTILIPTHNRPKLLRRTLSYISNEFKSKKYLIFVISDSSDDNIFFENKKNITLFGNHVEILHKDFRGSGVFEKMIKSIQDVNTKLIMPCGDDDFIIEDTLIDCCNFLIENDAYSHASGKIFTFRINKDNKMHGIQKYNQTSNEHDDKFARIVAHYKTYNNNFYNVHKTDKFRENLISSLTLDIGRGLKERLCAAICLAQGKRKVIPKAFLFRQKNRTGYDENGKRILDDNPYDQNYIHKVTHGYDFYTSKLCEILDVSKIDESTYNEILDTIKYDFDCAIYRQKKLKANRDKYHPTLIKNLLSSIIMFRNDLLLLRKEPSQDLEKIKSIYRFIENEPKH